MANDSRCSRQAVLLYRPRFRATRFPGTETRSIPYRVNHPLVPIQSPLSQALNIFGNRLSKHSPKSPHGPFVVELFTSEDLPRYPKQSRSGTACHQACGSRLGTTLNAALLPANPAYGFGRIKCNHTNLKTDGFGKNTCQSISESPRIGGEKRTKITIG